MSGIRQAILHPSQARYRWDVPELAPSEYLRAFAGIPPLVVQLLWNRGIRQGQDIANFLAAATAPEHSPWLMGGIADAVERIMRARDAGESVTVYGDYDVDGVSSTAILVECLQLLGVRVTAFLPRRDVEGYGLNSAALMALEWAKACSSRQASIAPRRA